GAANANDPRKGEQHLLAALEHLTEIDAMDDVELLIMGANNQLNVAIPSHPITYLSDDISLALLYSCADVFVAPSVQDNLPNTVMEALCCGVPCVAFSIGGMPDMISHQQNGYLC